MFVRIPRITSRPLHHALRSGMLLDSRCSLVREVVGVCGHTWDIMPCAARILRFELCDLHVEK